MPHAIRMHETGGPEVMRWEEVEVGQPGPGEVRVRNTALGLNFIDTYHRTGLYPMPLPTTLGMEGAGVVEAVGPKVKGFKVGDRVAYANPIGSYAEVCLRPVARLVKIPAGVDDKIAAAIMLKGMTAWYLCKRTFKVGKGQTILVHAAAGGVGPDLVAVGEVSRRDRDRHRRQRGESGAREKSRLQARDRDVERRFRRAREGNHERQRRAGRVRRRRQGHVHGLARLPGAARLHGEFRQRVGRGDAVQSGSAGGQRLALSDAADACSTIRPRRKISPPRRAISLRSSRKRS